MRRRSARWRDCELHGGIRAPCEVTDVPRHVRYRGGLATNVPIGAFGVFVACGAMRASRVLALLLVTGVGSSVGTVAIVRFGSQPPTIAVTAVGETGEQGPPGEQGRRAHGANKVLRAATEVTARGALLDPVVNRGRRANEGVGGCADFVVWSGPPVKSDPLVRREHRVNAV